jgi:hypothetical protein
MRDTTISDEDLKVAIANHGEMLTTLMLKTMANRHPHYKAITSELGNILLSQHIKLMKEVYEKIFSGDEDPKLIVRANVLNELFGIWSKIISSQDELINKLKGDFQNGR